MRLHLNKTKDVSEVNSKEFTTAVIDLIVCAGRPPVNH